CPSSSVGSYLHERDSQFVAGGVSSEVTAGAGSGTGSGVGSAAGGGGGGGASLTFFASKNAVSSLKVRSGVAPSSAACVSFGFGVGRPGRRGRGGGCCEPPDAAGCRPPSGPFAPPVEAAVPPAVPSWGLPPCAGAP